MNHGPCLLVKLDRLRSASEFRRDEASLDCSFWKRKLAKLASRAVAITRNCRAIPWCVCSLYSKFRIAIEIDGSTM